MIRVAFNQGEFDGAHKFNTTITTVNCEKATGYRVMVGDLLLQIVVKRNT